MKDAAAKIYGEEDSENPYAVVYGNQAQIERKLAKQASEGMDIVGSVMRDAYYSVYYNLMYMDRNIYYGSRDLMRSAQYAAGDVARAFQDKMGEVRRERAQSP